MDYSNLAYLKSGNTRQKAAYYALERLQLFYHLSDYRPLLTGTFPLAIDTDSSDLDISCEVYEPQQFAAKADEKYGHLPGFCIQHTLDCNLLTTVIQFHYQNWPVELYGQALPAKQQHAYRHMVIEQRILVLAGHRFREEVIRLKQKGLKTEPTFCRLLNLTGDPYAALLLLEDYSTEQLQHLLRQQGYLE